MGGAEDHLLRNAEVVGSSPIRGTMKSFKKIEQCERALSQKKLHLYFSDRFPQLNRLTGLKPLDRIRGLLRARRTCPRCG